MKEFPLEVLTGPWADIKPHLERGAVFFVSSELDLILVGEKVAADDVKTVGEWINQSMLARPTPAQIESWERAPESTFRFIIVAPYVLIQNQAH